MTRRDVQVSAGMTIVLFVGSMISCAFAGMGRGGNLGAAIAGGIMFIVAAMCGIMCLIALVAVRRQQRHRGFEPILKEPEQLSGNDADGGSK